LNVRTANGSKVELEGNADIQDVLVNSGGIYEAEKLESKITTVSCNAGGDITIFGKPKQINKKIIAGGTIEQAN
jgi:hypothetical protein